MYYPHLSFLNIRNIEKLNVRILDISTYFVEIFFRLRKSVNIYKNMCFQILAQF